MDSTSPIPRVGIVFRPQLPPERLREFVFSAEAAGLDDLWMWEDCLLGGGRPSAAAALAGLWMWEECFLEGGLPSAAAALAWSSSLRIGLGLMPVPLRNPALAA